MQLPLVSIIILNYNGKENTLECLESLTHSTYPNTRILVVDNASADGCAEIIQERFSEIVVIQNPKNYGFTGGNNIGIQYALDRLHADYVLLLNNDTVVAPDCIHELVTMAQSRQDIGAAGPKCYEYSEPQRIQSAGGQVSLFTGIGSCIGIGEIDQGQYNQPGAVGYLGGFAMLVKATVIHEVGLLDDEFFAYCEDLDWCLRMQKQGYQCVYVPTAKIWHKTHGSATTDRRVFLVTRNRVLLIRKHATPFQFAVFLLHFSVVQCLPNLLSFLRPSRWPALRAMFDGLLWHPGLRRQYSTRTYLQ